MSEPSVTVVTPTTGHAQLTRCLRSVQDQTHPAVVHLVVIDGQKRSDAAEKALANVATRGHPVRVLQLPAATGRDGYNGHRIYGAAGFLVDTDFVCFLDEDNWFDPEHLASLVDAVSAAGADWGFSLRTVVDQDGGFICLDQCDSLGSLHPAYDDDTDHLVDTNCYLLRTELAIRYAPLWHGRALTPGGPPPPDRALCRQLLAHSEPAATRRHTVNYAVGNRADSTTAEWFLTGNRIMAERYPEGLPWQRT